MAPKNTVKAKDVTQTKSANILRARGWGLILSTA